MTEKKRNIALLSASSASVVLAAMLASAPAFAQEQEAVLEQIVVTGSRILSPNATSISPVQVVTAESLEQGGFINLQDSLLESPVFGTPGISRTNSNFSTASAGAATVDLRNLGADRTLVLVNGRRFVAGIPTSSQVDLNTIPTKFIERVDILTGGASAVYGSDAVAGVVNIVYKTNFEGVEVDGRFGISERGDGTERSTDILVGGNFAEGRGNIISYLGYSFQGAIFSRDRERSAIDQISEGAAITGDPADFFTPRAPFFSSFAPQGRFFTTGGQFTFAPDGTLLNGFSTNGSATRNADGFNRSAFRTIAIPTERFLLATQAHYDINDHVTLFTEGTFAATQTRTELEPFPLDSGDLFPSTAGSYNIEFNDGGTTIRNPFVPDAIYNAATDTNGDGLRDISFSRRLSEVGNRGNAADRTTFRLLTGLKGALPFLEGWNYEAFYAFGQTEESQVSGGQVNVQNFANALQVITDVNDRDGDGNTTEAICLSDDARAQGCVPANPFGFGSISPEATDYIVAPGLLKTLTTQQVAGLNFSGSIIELPAGPLSVSIGGEWRNEFSNSQFDALQQAGLNAGNAIPATTGDFEVKEGYFEALIPIFKNQFLADSFNVRGAVRVSKYSTVDTVTSWNVGFDWAPHPDIRFRAVRATTVRAPNIGELFSPPSQNFPTGLNDPCVGVTATTGGILGAQCRAFPGVNANIAQNGAFTLTQADIQGISGFDRGNPDASEERGRSWTAGVVISPKSFDLLRNTNLTIDYFRIRISDALVSTPRQFILDQCFSQGVQSFCDFITRRATGAGANSAGSLEFIDSAVTNSGGLFTSGLDVNLTQRFDLESINLPGVLNFRAAYTHTFDGFVTPLPGSDPDPFAGEVGASKNRFLADFVYNWGPVTFSWRTTYIGPASLDDQFLAGFDLEPGSVGIGRVIYNDIQLRTQIGKSFEWYVGVDNLFDKDPPPIITGLPGNDTGTETDAGTYDPIGRRIYTGVKLRF